MSRYDDGGWPAYVPVAERRRKAEREAARLRKAGRAPAPVRIEGRAIAATAWGRAWCDNLESYRDYESRLPRGRAYVRNGSVIDLQIGPCEIKALVSGSSIYRVAIGVAAVPAARWRSIRADCAGRIESLVELLQGRLSQGVMERMCRQGTGLFPKPSEIRFSCSCLDHASMCKHVAAVLYGVGARLDASPELLFRLRAVDAGDLVADLDSAMPTLRPAGNRVLSADDVSALFGLDLAVSGTMDDDEDTDALDPSLKPVAPATLSQTRHNAGRSRPVRADEDPATAVSLTKVVSVECAVAQPASPKSKASRLTRMPVTAQQHTPLSSATLANFEDSAAAQDIGTKRLGKKEAERVVADVVARIRRHLVMGVDVTTARPGTPADDARGVRTVCGPATGSSSQTPGRKQLVVRPMKKHKRSS